MHPFWANLTPAQCLPSSCNCEFIRSEIIAQPFSFWSSLIYVVIGVLFLQKKNNHILWGGTLIVLGFSSMFAHGSFTELALSMDFASIIIILLFSTVIDFKFLSNLKRKFFFLIAEYIMLVWLLFNLNKWPKISLALMVFLLALGNIFYKRKTLKLNKDFYKGFFLICISFILFLVDELKVLCSPNGFLHGHTFWHLGSGVALYYFGKWRFSDR